MTSTIQNKKITINYIFNDDDWRCIEVFKRRAQELLKVDILAKKGSGISSNVQYKQDEGMTLKVTLPPEENLRSLYMAFRFFYGEKEPSNFNRVANILKKTSGDELFQQFIENLKQQYSGSLYRKHIMQVKVNGEEVTTKRLLDLWFNANYFHSDEKKENDLKIWNETLSQDLSRFILANAVYEACKAVIRLYKAMITLEQGKPLKD